MLKNFSVSNTFWEKVKKVIFFREKKSIFFGTEMCTFFTVFTMVKTVKKERNSKKTRSSVRSPSVRFGSKFEAENSTRSSSRFENSTRIEFEKKWFGPMSIKGKEKENNGILTK